MTSSEPSPPKGQKRATRTARTLAILAGFVFVISVITAVVPTLVESIDRRHIPMVEVVSDIVGRVTVGVALAVTLLGLASALRLLWKIKNSLSRLERFEYESKSANASVPDEAQLRDSDAGNQKSALQLHEMLLILRDIRDNSLLSEEERRE